MPLTAPVPPAFAAALDPGEAEALALAAQVKATLGLLDESAARLKASPLGIPHIGMLGVLLRAMQSGQILSLAIEIRKLRQDARFFVGPALEKDFWPQWANDFVKSASAFPHPRHPRNPRLSVLSAVSGCG